MRNKYQGVCFLCKKKVEKQEGWFQSKTHLSYEEKKEIKGRRVLRCLECKGKGNK